MQQLRPDRKDAASEIAGGGINILY